MNCKDIYGSYVQAVIEWMVYMRKRYLLPVFALVLILSGCTGDNQEVKQPVAEQEPDAGEVTAAPEEITAVPKQEEQQAEDAIMLKLDSTVKYQILESFGTSGAWWSQYVGGWDNEYKDTGRSVREEIAKLLFDKEEGIGLTCYRYNVGAGSVNGEGEYWDYYRRTQSFETAPFTYDWNKDANAVWFMKEAVRLGVEEVIFFCNSPLERLTINGRAQLTKGTGENILPENYDDFARYVMDVAEHFIEEGVPVKFISPINEPQWEWAGGQEGCHYEPSKIAGVYRAFFEELQSRATMAGVELSGPESGEWGGRATEYVSALLNDTVLGEHITAIDNHSYWSDTASKTAFKRWMDARYPEVKLRMSEWCEMVNGSDVTMDSAFHLAEVVAEDLTVLNVVSWQTWVGIAPGGYRDGLIYVNQQKKLFNPLKRLWGYGNYTKFIRPGYQRIDVSGQKDALQELKPVAFTGINEEGREELVLVVINEAGEKQVALDIIDEVEYNRIDMFETSEENDLTSVANGEYKTGNVITIGEGSITTIILSKAGD